MTPRITHTRAALLRDRLSPVDLEVLASLYRLRLLTSRQIQRLHPPAGSALAQARRTRARLQRLRELRVIVHLGRRVGGLQPGSGAAIFGLSGLGLAVLGVNGPYGRRRRTVWDTKPHFTRHVLAVAEVCVGLTEAARSQPGVDLLAFDGEPAAWRMFTGPTGASLTLRPDAYVRVGVGDYERVAFLEVDMSTESVPTLRRRCDRYVSFWRSRTEQQARGIFPQILWLSPDDHGVTRLREEVIDRLQADVRFLFAVARQADGPALLTASVEAMA
ncbi:replication-relaxation family protein [Amycolatopsis sp. NPDC003731]